ncbi:MAG: archease, partial [Candidatus Micrarchaeota archaeon]
MAYKFLEHTADIFVEAEAKNFQEAISEAANAMFEFMGGKEGEGKEFFVVEEKAENKGELVVSFLSSILAESEINEILPCKIEILEYGEGRIKAKI